MPLIKPKLVRESQIVQSTIYSSDIVVTQVLTPVVLPLGSRLLVRLSPLQIMSRQKLDKTKF